MNESAPDKATAGILHLQALGELAQVRAQFTERDNFLLSRAIKALVDLRTKGNIYKFVATRVSELLPNSVVLVCSFDETALTLNVRAAVGLGNNVDKLVTLLGQHPVHFSAPINDEARNGLGKGRLEKVSGGIYELATGAISLKVCHAIEKLLNVTGTYAMGLTWSGAIMGSVAILVRDNNVIANTVLVESFINFSAVALHRRLKGIVSWV